MLHNAAFAESVETLCHCGRVHQVPRADLGQGHHHQHHVGGEPYLAGDHLIDRADVDLPLPCRDSSYGCSCLRHDGQLYSTPVQVQFYTVHQYSTCYALK